MITQQMQYGTTTIEYQLTFAQRKTLGISVHLDCSVRVVAPVGSDPAAIEAKLQQRSAWIVNQQQHFERYLPLLPRQYVSGETHLYLSKQEGWYRAKAHTLFGE